MGANTILVGEVRISTLADYHFHNVLMGICAITKNDRLQNAGPAT